MISESSECLYKSLDQVYQFSKRKHLTISVEKSKSVVFNQAGRVIKNHLNLNNEILEQIHSFFYLGFDVKCSGTVEYSMNILCDKTNKALRPLLCAIARIPAKSSLRLFHTFISPILLYNAENWAILSDKGIKKNFNSNTILDDTSGSKIDVVHRKHHKFIFGVSKSYRYISDWYLQQDKCVLVVVLHYRLHNSDKGQHRYHIIKGSTDITS